MRVTLGTGAWILAGVLAPPVFAQATASPDRAFALAPFWAAARDGRADVVMIGDSNQLFGSDGWDSGWARAAAERFGVYATGVMAAGAEGGVGSSIGEGWSIAPISRDEFEFGYAGAAFDPQAGTPLTNIAYAHVPRGLSSASVTTTGMQVTAGGVLDVNGWLRYHLQIGRFSDPAAAGRVDPYIDTTATGIAGPAPIPFEPPLPLLPPPDEPAVGSLVGGSAMRRTTEGPLTFDGGWFTACARYDEPPYSNIIVYPRLSTLGSRDEWVQRSFDLPAVPRNKSVGFRWAAFGGAPIEGPFVAMYERVEQVDRAHGLAVSTLAGLGGRGAFDMADVLRISDDRALAAYFGQVRMLQGPRKHVLVRINTGLNDRLDNRATYGVPYHACNTIEGFDDNMSTMIDRLTALWARMKWPRAELFFLITPSHPVGSPDDARLVSFRVAAQRVAARYPRTAAVDLGQLVTSGEMESHGWYATLAAGGPDHNHLSRDGAFELARREVGFADTRSCAVDWNGNGVADADDLTLFVQAASAASPQADFDEDGFTNASDITAFLQAWLLGCD